MRRTFETPSPLEIHVQLPAGRLELTAHDSAETTVEVEPLDEAARARLDEVRIDLSGDRLTIEAPERRRLVWSSGEYAVVVHCPTRSKLDARTASADVTARGTLGELTAKSASGDLEAGSIDGVARVNTASGDVEIDSVALRAEVRTVSGDVRLDEAGAELSVTSVSGDVFVVSAVGPVQINTVSGDQRVDSTASSITTKSVSGDVTIGVRPGATIWLDVRSVSGDTSTDLDMGADEPAAGAEVLEVRARSVSGDVRITRATTRVPGI